MDYTVVLRGGGAWFANIEGGVRVGRAAAEREGAMDEITLQAMAKWPDVPDVFGWLNLDRRGRWAIKGETLTRRSLVDLIGRNYAVDEHGRWFFQNGPQRVFVELAYLPLVLHWEAGREAERLATHTGLAVKRLSAAYLDEEGALLLV